MVNTSRVQHEISVKRKTLLKRYEIKYDAYKK